MKFWSLKDKNDYLLDFIHLVYSPRGIQYFNIQPVSSKLVYFLIALVYVSVCVLNWRFMGVYTKASSDSSSSSVRIM